MALRDMGSLVCVYHSMQQVGLERSELGNQVGLSSAKLKDAERLIESRQQEIINAWNNHFRG
jgi:hypothetical protein